MKKLVLINDFKGRVLEGKYELIQQLGKGGMGAVFLAKDLKLETFWAIKIVEKKEHSPVDLLVEPNMLKKLEHPSLPRITDIIQEEKYMYIVMDFIDGRTLEDIAAEEGTISEENLVEWAKEICNVLSYLHKQEPNPIIYRDMKPANIMLTKDKRIKLIDFGIAREFKEDSSSDTTALGTKGYAAPEQYAKIQTDERTDIYGLGVTLYNLLTGKKPEQFLVGVKPLREIDTNFSEGIEFIIKKCTQREPDNRYQSVDELIYDLKNIYKIGKEYEIKKRIKGLKIVASSLGIILSCALLLNGWSDYGVALAKEYNKYITSGKEERSNLRFNEAFKYFEEAQDYLPKNKEAYYEVAKTYMGMWSLNESIRYLNNKMQTDPKFQEDDYAQYIIGKAYFLKTNYELALEYFANVSDSKNVDEDYAYLVDISKVLLEGKKNVKETLAAQAIGEADEGLDPLQSLREAISNFEAYVDKLEDKVLALNLYIATADLYMQLSSLIDSREVEQKQQQVDNQIRVLTKAKQITANDYTVLERLAIAYREKARMIRFGNKDEYEKNLYASLDLYSQCLTLSDSMDVYRNIGDIYAEMSKYQEAEEAYLSMVSSNPNHYLGYLKLASINNTQGKIDKAREYLTQAEACDYFRDNDPIYTHLQKSLTQGE